MSAYENDRPPDPRWSQPSAPGQPYPGQPYAGQPPAGAPGPPRRGRDRVSVALIALLGLLLLVAVVLAVLIWSPSGGSDRPPAAVAAVTSASGAAAQNPLPGGASPQRPPPPSAEGVVQPVGVSATCQADPGTDAAGNPITYEPELTLDGLPETAWRCPGAATGQQLVYDFGRAVTITAVGLVPGYAKIDPSDGTNRFTENRTVTGATWQFDDGTRVNQLLAAPQPELTTAELPAPITTTRVVLVIGATGNGAAARDFTAISDIAFTGL